MNKAVECKFECPSCGAILKTKETLQRSGRHFKFAMPVACKCGRKGAFTLLDFEQMESMIVSKEQHDKIVKLLTGDGNE